MNRLTVIAGLNQGKIFDIRKGRMSIGRTPDNDLQIDDPSISRRHAEIVADDEHAVIRDLESTNGTMVDGQLLTQGYELKPGNIITFGDINVSFETVTAVAQTPTAVIPAGGIPATPPPAPVPTPAPAAAFEPVSESSVMATIPIPAHVLPPVVEKPAEPAAAKPVPEPVKMSGSVPAKTPEPAAVAQPVAPPVREIPVVQPKPPAPAPEAKIPSIDIPVRVPVTAVSPAPSSGQPVKDRKTPVVTPDVKPSISKPKVEKPGIDMPVHVPAAPVSPAPPPAHPAPEPRAPDAAPSGGLPAGKPLAGSKEVALSSAPAGARQMAPLPDGLVKKPSQAPAPQPSQPQRKEEPRHTAPVLPALAFAGVGSTVMRVRWGSELFDRRAVIYGLLVAGLVLMIAFVWTLAPNLSSLRKVERDFEFAVAEPKIEEFKLNEPIRDIMKETSVMETMERVEQVEAPNIQVSTAPTEVKVEQMVIKSENISMETPKIDVGATETEIQDAPLDIAVVSDTPSYALDVIATDASGPADFYKHTEPVPPNRMQLYTYAQAPKPGRPMKNLPKAFGDKDAPTMGKLGPADINLFGNSDFFSAMRSSGPIQARTAVDSALTWLALHQEPDGMYICSKYGGGPEGDLASTALAALAFMGAGNTIRKGEYRRNVVKCIEAIMRKQADNGRIGPGLSLYSHSISTIALCEAVGRARDERIGAAAQKAVTFCEKSTAADGGWRYQPKSDVSDMSVTSWFIQALKTAKLAQMKFDESVFAQALTFVDVATDQGAGKDSAGFVVYCPKEAQQNAQGNAWPALTCASMVIRQFHGMGVKNHILIKGAEGTKQNPPNWNQKNFYYWYYATYAMHNMGGEYRIWWNQRIRDVLLPNQARKDDNAGSWDPQGDTWAQNRGGRVYTTALGALCLEVYYRYSDSLNSFGVAPDIDDMFLQ